MEIRCDADRCDLCPNPAEWYDSPLFNPDEPKMCDQCYRKLVEPGAIDWEAYRKVEGRA